MVLPLICTTCRTTVHVPAADDGTNQEYWRLLGVPVEPVDLADGRPQAAEVTVAKWRQPPSHEPELPTTLDEDADALDGDHSPEASSDSMSLIYAPNRIWQWMPSQHVSVDGQVSGSGIDLWWSYRPREHILQHQRQHALSKADVARQTRKEVAYDDAQLRLATAVEAVFGTHECRQWSAQRKAFWGLPLSPDVRPRM